MRKPKAPYVQLNMVPPDDVPDNFDPKTWIIRNADLIAPFGEMEACCDATITRKSFREQLALMGEFLYADGTKLPQAVRDKFDSAVLAMAMSALPDRNADNPAARIRTITPEEFAWTEQQPVNGRPNLTRLCAALETIGLPPVAMERSDDGTSLDFTLERDEEVRGLDEEQTLRRLIMIFRASGFEIGFVEMAIYEFEALRLRGFTFVGPLELIGAQIPVLVEP